MHLQMTDELGQLTQDLKSHGFIGLEDFANALRNHEVSISHKDGSKKRLRTTQVKFPFNFEEYAPGTIVGVWKGDKRVFSGHFGVSNIFTREQTTTDQHFRIGSVTKTMTGVLFLQLVEQGKVKLSDQASDYLPQVPKGITMLQLGNMTSGLYNYSEDEEFLLALDDDPNREWNPEELLTIGLKHKPYFEPGLGWYYSNTNYIILGLIIEKLTGDKLAALYKKRIFDPLGMSHSSMGEPLPAPYSHGYMYGYNSTRPTENNAKPESVIRDVTHCNPSWAWAAGAVVSTLEDLKIFARSLVDGTGGLLSSETIALREQAYCSTRFSYYGFGMFGIGGYFGHNGNIPGYQCTMFYNEKRDMTIVVMSNLCQRKSGVTPADCITREMIQILEDIDLF